MAPVRKRATAPTAASNLVKKTETKIEAVKEEVKTEAVKVVEPKKEEKKAEKKAGKKAEKKTAEKKPAATKKTAVQAVESTFYLQFDGREVSQNSLEDRLKEVWTKDMGKDLAEIKKVTYYVKPEEATAYFVVNDEVEGNFAI